MKLPTIKLNITDNTDYTYVMKVIESLPEGKYEVQIRKPKRTNQQNRAMHKFFDIIADQLNETGNMFSGKFFKEGYESEWTPQLVKEILWKSIQIAMYGKKSTAQLTTTELTKVADYLEKQLSRIGLDIVFPSITSLLNER